MAHYHVQLRLPNKAVQSKVGLFGYAYTSGKSFNQDLVQRCSKIRSFIAYISCRLYSCRLEPRPIKFKLQESTLLLGKERFSCLDSESMSWEVEVSAREVDSLKKIRQNCFFFVKKSPKSQKNLQK